MSPVLSSLDSEMKGRPIILTTDFGQAENPSPVEGMRRYIREMLEFGFNQNEIERMTRTNPAELLGI